MAPKTWQQCFDAHWKGLSPAERKDPRIKNLVRIAADAEMAEQAGNQGLAQQLYDRYDRAVRKLGRDPLA